MNKFLMFIVAVVVVGGLFYLLAPILTPFLVGALLAYLVNPIVSLLMRLHVSRLGAIAIVFLSLLLFVLLFLFLVVPLIQTQVYNLIDAIPDMMDWLQNTVVPLLQERFGVQNLIDVNSIKSYLTQNWTQAGGVVSLVIKSILHSGVALLSYLMNIILIPVVTFYLLFDWNKTVTGLRNLIPRRYEKTVVRLVTDCNDVLSAFFRGQLLVMLTLGILYSVGFMLAGLKVGLMIGLMIGVLCIVPYLGVIIGIIASCIAAYVQFGTFTSLLPVLLVFAVVQPLDSTFITPKLVGGRIGLHPVAVIFAVLAGGVLYGFFGVLLALPAASVIMVLVRYFYQRYRGSQLYQ